jgi:tetratricopeptide (TPR) repeat protein
MQLESLYATSQRFDEAVSVGRRALDASIALDGPSATNTTSARRFLGGALLSAGRRQSDQQNYQEAEKSLREGVQLFDPPLPGWEDIFATSLAILGKIYETNGRAADAEAYFLRALDYRAKLVQPTDPLLLKILANLAAHYDQTEKPTESGAYAQRVISALDQAHVENSELGSALTWLGRSQHKLGLYSESETTYARAVEVIDRSSRPNDPQRASVQIDMAVLSLAEEKYEKAEREYRAALALAEKYSYSDSSLRSSILGGLSTIYRDRARYREAEQTAAEAMAIDEAAGPARAPLVGKRLMLLASIFAAHCGIQTQKML